MTRHESLVSQFSTALRINQRLFSSVLFFCDSFRNGQQKPQYGAKKRKSKFPGERYNASKHAKKPDLNASIEKILVNQDSYCDFSGNDFIFDIVDMYVIFNIIAENLLCSRCRTKSLEFKVINRVGLMSEYVIKCNHQLCDWEMFFLIRKSTKQVSFLFTKLINH